MKAVLVLFGLLEFGYPGSGESGGEASVTIARPPSST